MAGENMAVRNNAFDAETIMLDLCDHVLPYLSNTEAKVYLWFLVNSYLRTGTRCVRIGYGTLCKLLGKGGGEGPISQKTMQRAIRNLRQQEFIGAIDSNKEGTKYVVSLPCEVIGRLHAKAIAGVTASTPLPEVVFQTVRILSQIFTRDEWRCQYCGDTLSPVSANIDHFIPQSRGGSNDPDNLKTCCLACNSIKNDKTYEEAAPLLLKSIQERRGIFK